jgi:endonuclease YncB( thermonuclease family)
MGPPLRRAGIFATLREGAELIVKMGEVRAKIKKQKAKMWYPGGMDFNLTLIAQGYAVF